LEVAVVVVVAAVVWGEAVVSKNARERGGGVGNSPARSGQRRAKGFCGGLLLFEQRCVASEAACFSPA
jgi:hypothetical protein